MIHTYYTNASTDPFKVQFKHAMMTNTNTNVNIIANTNTNLLLLIIDRRDVHLACCLGLRGALKTHFWKKLGFWPNKGEGGLTEAQVFVEIFQKQIFLGKWPEM